MVSVHYATKRLQSRDSGSGICSENISETPVQMRISMPYNLPRHSNNFATEQIMPSKSLGLLLTLIAAATFSSHATSESNPDKTKPPAVVDPYTEVQPRK